MISMSVCLSVSPRGYLRNDMYDLHQTFGTVGLDLHPAKGTKSAIYDCLVCFALFGIDEEL